MSASPPILDVYQTGELTVQRGKVKKTVFFSAGAPCFAISNLVTDRFGPFMVRIGKITQGQLDLVRAAADKTGRRTGDVLGNPPGDGVGAKYRGDDGNRVPDTRQSLFSAVSLKGCRG